MQPEDMEHVPDLVPNDAGGSNMGREGWLGWVTGAHINAQFAEQELRRALEVLEGRVAVSRPFSSWNRPISTEIYLCHACSCHEMLTTMTAGQEMRADPTTPYSRLSDDMNHINPALTESLTQLMCGGACMHVTPLGIDRRQLSVERGDCQLSGAIVRDPRERRATVVVPYYMHS
eukprot:COSAG01_NODE_11617_length_1893_cov_31.678715_2_plen_175_part_00